MHYQFDKIYNYEDFSSGRVLSGAPSATNFPVRLGNEVFNRCLQYSIKKENLKVYDPCCGCAYLLTTITFLNYDKISNLFGSDINNEVLQVAEKNLSLLNKNGLLIREDQIRALYNEFDKVSHQEALQSIEQLKKIAQAENSIVTELFEHDIFFNTNNRSFAADIIISDVPYGEVVSWVSKQDVSLNIFLDCLKPFTHPLTIIAVVHTREQKLMLDNSFMRLEKFKVGKRIVEILQFNQS